jgi:hypothetical protein
MKAIREVPDYLPRACQHAETRDGCVFCAVRLVLAALKVTP